MNGRTSRLISSLKQDMFFVVHFRNVLTPKSVLLILHIKSLCSKKELITLVSRFNHGLSYTKLLEISTEVDNSKTEKQANQSPCLPEGCRKNMFSTIIEDNIDRNEQTLIRLECCQFYLNLRSSESDKAEKINAHKYSKSTNNLKVFLG